ncbi:uncharacterized protein TNCV_1130001 [Trichonephila clavipes]|nr:uncharacterized protein TNCV_1130001 [Trichonephila clavipes]
MTLPWIKSCRPYLETTCNKGFPRLIPKNLRKQSIFLSKAYQVWTRVCKNGFGTTLVGPVSTAHHYRLGNLGRWLDRVTYYEPDYPYTILFEPNFGVHIPRSFGKTVIVFTSHLDLTWDKGVELRFFQVGRSPSHRVWEAYQPHMTDAYSVDFTDCPRVADVYVKWLTWLDDWEMHRDDPVPWRIVGLLPWKRALEKHVQRSHEMLWSMGCPLTSRSSTIYKASHPPLESFCCLKQHVCVESTRLFCACQRVSSRGQASAHRIVHCHDSQEWKRSRNHVHHRESCRVTIQAQRCSIQLPRECPSSSGTPPVTQECARGIPALLREGQV